jgi:lysophospholipase L1-like esterase
LVFHNSSNRLQVLIDGRPVFGSMPVLSGVSGSGYVFDFGAVMKTRRVTVVTLSSAGGSKLRGCAMTAQGSLGLAAPSTSDVMLMLGDSFCATVTPTVSDGHLGSYLKRHLGLGGCINAGVGGSGYVAANANTYNLPAMVSNASNTTLWNYLAPNHIFIHAVGNDRNGTLATVQAAALATWTALRAKFPAAKITITDGYSGNSGPDANAITFAAGMLTTFNAWADTNSRFVKIVGAGTSSTAYITGTGRADQALTTGNSSLFTSTDSTHVSPAGARYLAERLADAIKAAWQGDY